MNAETVGQQLSDRLGTILNGRSTPYAPDTIEPPAGYVFGDETEFHLSYQNGLSRARFSVTVAVPRTPLAAAWKLLAAYVSPSGDMSVKRCLETGTYTAFHTIIVPRARIGNVDIGGVTYKAAGWDIEITGSGS